MPLGIRPTNDFAFKKTFGTPENRPALISLLNSMSHAGVRILEGLLGAAAQPDAELQAMTLDQLEARTRDLQESLRKRN